MATLSLGEQTACGHLSKPVSPTRPFRVTVLVEVTWCECQVKTGEEFTLSKRKIGCRAFAQEGILLKAGISRCYYTCISVQTRSHAPPHSAGWKGGESKAPTQPLNLSCWWRAVRALAVRTGCCSDYGFFQRKPELGKPYRNFRNPLYAGALCGSGCTRFAVMGKTLQTDLVGYSLWSPNPSLQPPNVPPSRCLAHPSAMVRGPAHGSLPIPLVGFPKQGLLTQTCIPHHHKKLSSIEWMQQSTEQVLPALSQHLCPALWLSLPFFLHSIEEETCTE